MSRCDREVNRGRAGMVAGAVVAALLWAAVPLSAAQWHVAPDGKADGGGTAASPWDLASALAGRQKQVKPGDTILLAGGTYKVERGKDMQAKLPVKLAGTADAPMKVMPAPGARATIDGGLSVQAPSEHLWIIGLEIMVSEPRPADPLPPAPNYANLNLPWGGLELVGGRNCRYIHLVIHDCNQGISAWTPETDALIYGCVIYDNGWQGTDRGHGHAIYTQNQNGTKTIDACIMTGGYSFSMHAYGSKNAWVDHYLITRNIAYAGRERFLVGGGRPSQDIRVIGNYLHGVSMQIGYNAPHNEDCVVKDNVIVGGGLSINKYNKVEKENNLVIGPKDPRPDRTIAGLIPSEYEPQRAHLAVYALGGGAAGKEAVRTVPVERGGFLQPGQAYRLMDPRDLWGKPVHEGTCGEKSFDVPVKGEFACYVVLAGEVSQHAGGQRRYFGSPRIGRSIP